MVEEIEHPEGCMCIDCRIERGELSEEELNAPEYPPRPNFQPPEPKQQFYQPKYEQPPIAEAPKKKRRTTPAPTNNGRREYPETYTQPVRPPGHQHSQYIYQWGEMRRCHLCAPYEASMRYDVDNPIWFASLEDRARHILEVHTDVSDPIIKMERQRAKEVLAIQDVWDRHSSSQSVEFAKPTGQVYDMPPTKQEFQGIASLFKKKPQSGYKRPNWFSQHKVMTVIIVIALLYGLYIMYLMSQGYEF